MTRELTLQVGTTCARIESRGAQLRSLSFHGKEVLWPGKKGSWEDSAPLLFPVVGRLSHDTLRKDGHHHPHPMHGIARRAEFSLLEQLPDTALFVWEHAAGEAFPWAFRIEQRFSLAEDTFQLSVRVSNPSPDEELPFQIGWHPGFSGTSLQVSWEGKRPLRIHEVTPGKGWRTGTTRTVLQEEDGFLAQAHPTAWVTDLDVGRIELHGGSAPLTIETSPSPLGWTFWQGVGGEFCCPEPWFGLPDRTEETCDFRDREGTRRLPPGKDEEFIFRIKKAP